MNDEKQYLGKSSGIVGDAGLGWCEHCGSLPKGVDWYRFGGTCWCACCINDVEREEKSV